MMNNNPAQADEDTGAVMFQTEHHKTADNEGTGREVAIQTNPHEIERSLGQLPLRKRFVPLKFSDYCVFANNVKEEDLDVDVVEDADFTPTETFTKPVSSSRDDKQKRSRGRPRKHKDTDTVNNSTSSDCKSEGNKQENLKRNPITKVPNGFKCSICSKIFTLRGNAKTHLITHTDDRPYACDFNGCGKYLRTKESLRRHRLSHLGIKMFECPECNKKFSCNLGLQEHMTLHSGEKPLSCNVCGTKFRQIAVLKRHMTTHSNFKPYACEICGKKFSLKVYVRSHMKTHTGERPFSCDSCNKCFAHASDLNRHKIIHSGQKPYKCSICPMRYSDPSSRRRHEREHESKPQYVCHLCKQQFPRAGQLRVHLVKEHTNATTTTTTSSSHINQHNAEGPDQFQKDPGSSNRIMNLQSGLVQTTVPTTSDTGGGLGKQVNTVQILDTSCVSQINNGGKAVVHQAPLQGDMPTIQQGGLQAVVMELPRDAEQFTRIPAGGTTYKVINTDNGDQVFEIQVEKEPQVPFHVQDLSSEMKINMSDIEISDGRLVAFIQDGNSVTVMEQTTENVVADELPNNNNDNTTTIDIMVQPTVDENCMVLSSIEKVVDVSSSIQDVNSVTENERECIVKNYKISSNQENVTHDICEERGNNIHPPMNTKLVQRNSGYEACPIEKVNNDYVNNIIENQNSSSELHHSTPTDHNISDNQNPPAEIISQVIPVSNAISSFVENPDLSSQDYYNWLSSFSEECKHFSIPLPKELFQKISHVQKTLSDFMAMPTGVITDKNNFKILMGITQDLSQIMSNHLSLIYSNLNK